MMAILFALSVAILVGCDNRETILMIEKPTEVRSMDQTPSSSESTNSNVQPGHVIATLKAGETAKAIGVYHGKDYDGFQVKLADGTEGLIIAAETFKVVSR
jgi:hypothetical protein